MSKRFEPLPLSAWRATRDTLANYTRVVRRIRQYNSPKQKHYWHVSLRPTTTGLTTTPIRTGDGIIYELEFNFPQHCLTVKTSEGDARSVGLRGQSITAFEDEVLTALEELRIRPAYDREEFSDDSPGTYDETAVCTFWRALIEIDTILKEFRYGFLEETSPVQFWPHHFDLAVVWFSGRKVPGKDPETPEYACEQMNFGFSTGDEGTPDPYFYATAYPEPEGWTGAELPAAARWHSDGWNGALLPYQALVDAGENGRQLLFDFLQAAQEAGASRMQDGRPDPVG